MRRYASAFLLILGLASLGCHRSNKSDCSTACDGSVEAPIGSTITSVTISDTRAAGASPSDTFATFGQVFKRGDVPQGATVVGRASDGSGVPLQVDAKATYSDGSLRHAVLTAHLTQLAGGEKRTLQLVSAKPSAAQPGLDLAALAGTAFDGEVRVTISGTTYAASVRPLLAGASSFWLDGPLAKEASLSAPLKDPSGNAHPHLAARFQVRMLEGSKSARIDFIVENDWAWQASPQNYTYDLAILVGGTQVYAKTGVTHIHQARWRETFYWGDAPTVFVAEDPAYLMKSGAVPNYDPTITADPMQLATYGMLADPPWDPMQIGQATAYMPTTGGRPDIGLLPAWATLYLISMDPRAAKATLMTADGAGSWPIHYRDQATDRPASLVDHPYMTLLGNPGDAVNPATGKSDAFPACGGDCTSPYAPDSAHAPSLVYLPYLLTGDRYYLEELQFWAGFDMLQANPYYRGFEKGLLKWDQIRGQAWSMRALGEAAAFTPDADPMKQYFVDRIGDNLTYYDTSYGAGGAERNALGILAEGGAFAYQSGRGVAAWQDDFFTSAVGHLVELGFPDAAPLLAFKAQAPIGRMTGDGYCWIIAAPYELIVRDSATSPLYTTFAQVYAQSAPASVMGLPCDSQAMATALMLKVGEMSGYASSSEGYPSNMQPALAMAAGSGATGAAAAWTLFASRPVKPTDYAKEPQFAIVPR